MDISSRIVGLESLPAQEVAYVYQQLLRPAFRPEELPTLKEILRVYSGEDAAPSGVLIQDGEPVGIYLCASYVGGRVRLLTHMAVSAKARGAGIGSRLLDHVAHRQDWPEPADLVLAEVDDPRVWPADAETGDPVARLRFYERHGARLLSLAHVQPEVRPGSGRVRGMFLLCLDRGPAADAGLLAEFLAEYFTECEGPESLADPEVQELLAAASHVPLADSLRAVSEWQQLPVGGRP